MVLGLLGAFAAALCYGAGSVMQAIAARNADTVQGLDARLLVRLFGSWRYIVGVGLDLLGFALSIAAVRVLPLFVVQAVVAGSLAVTAVIGAVMLAMPLTRWDKLALGVVLSGLALVALSAAEDRSVDVSRAEEWGVLAAVVLLTVAAVPLAQLQGTRGAVALGAVAGLAFGATAVAARMLPGSLAPGRITQYVDELLVNPATYALAGAGVLALLTYSTALQRGSVTQATAPLVVGETVAPAIVGLVLLGDAPRPGWGWVATVGFVLAVLGALSLSRHGEVGDGDTDEDEGVPVPHQDAVRHGSVE